MQSAKLAVRTAFIANGFSVGALVARLPDFKIQLDASTGEIGRMLFCISFGVLFALSFIGKVIARKGSKPIAVFGSIATALALIPIAFSNTTFPLAISFFVFGVFLTIQDVAMNSHAATLEHETKSKLMSNFHALFSVGALSGGLVGGLFAQINISIQNQCFLLALLFILMALAVRNLWLPAEIDIHKSDEVKKEKTLKKPAIFFFIGLLGMAAAINEGAAGDWGGILARDTFNASPFLATLPYIVFNIGMVGGRFAGDYIMERFGTFKILFRAGLTTGIGLTAGILIGNIYSQIFAWFAIGLGMSVVIPAVFSAGATIARERFAGKIAPSEGVAIVSGISYFGFLGAPPTIGYIAEVITLRWAMLIPAALAIFMAIGSRFIKSS
ncbi:MAG: MFS transporter [Candidatus Nanopelagicaceae bacterium]